VVRVLPEMEDVLQKILKEGSNEKFSHILVKAHKANGNDTCLTLGIMSMSRLASLVWKKYSKSCFFLQI
jgi:hypothetical protein